MGSQKVLRPEGKKVSGTPHRLGGACADRLPRSDYSGDDKGQKLANSQLLLLEIVAGGFVLVGVSGTPHRLGDACADRLPR